MKVVSFFPHMHTRGKSWECRILYPDGRTETVLSVPRYDFNWQHTYRCAEPLRVPAGSKFQCIAHYDNSNGNSANPDPTQAVKWGPQTWDEMMVCGLEYIVESRPETRPASPSSAVTELPREQVVRAAKALSPEGVKLLDTPFQLDLDTDQATGLIAGKHAVMVIPDKRLTQELLDRAKGEVVPVGQLWFKDWVPTVEGRAPAAEKWHTILVKLGSEQHRLGLCLLGVCKNANGVFELVVYSKDKAPLLRLPLLKVDTGSNALKMKLATEPTTNQLLVTVIGKYQAVLTLTLSE